MRCCFRVRAPVSAHLYGNSGSAPRNCCPSLPSTASPIVLEAVREVLQDVYDVPGLIDLCRDIESRKVRIVEVETATPSPFARSLLFGYIAQFMYEGDSPLAERRAAALSLDPALLAELLGQTGLAAISWIPRSWPPSKRSCNTSRRRAERAMQRMRQTSYAS